MTFREEAIRQLREDMNFQVQVFDGFSGESDLIEAFNLSEDEAKVLKEDLIIITAEYDTYCYEGYAEIYYFDTRDGQFYEVHGGHCSCYGLEDQWTPEVIGDLAFYQEYMRKKKQNN